MTTFLHIFVMEMQLLGFSHADFSANQATPQLWPVRPTRTWLTAWLWSYLPWSLSLSGTLPPAPPPRPPSPPLRVSTCWSTAASPPPAPLCPATASTTATSKTATVHRWAWTGVCLSELSQLLSTSPPPGGDYLKHGQEDQKSTHPHVCFLCMYVFVRLCVRERLVFSWGAVKPIMQLDPIPPSPGSA